MFHELWEKNMHGVIVACSIDVSYIKDADGAMNPCIPNNIFCHLLRLILKSPVIIVDLPVLFLFSFMWFYSLFVLHVYIVGIVVSCGSTRLLFDTVFLLYFTSFSVNVLSHMKIAPVDDPAYWL